MTQTALKSCPFCGGEGCVNEHVFHGYASTYGVVCLDCNSETMQFYETEELAVQAWNRRGGGVRNGPIETVNTSLYDIEETHSNCTVQVLRNSVTGKTSVGWWENE